MLLSEWRKSQNVSRADMALALGLTGDRGETSVWNWESGRARADADMVERIGRLTGGAVTAQDMHETRLAWLKANRPEKFGEGGGTAPPSALREEGRAACLARPSDPPASQGENSSFGEAAE